MIIYKTTNLVSGEFYIGKDSKNNPSYIGSGSDFLKDVKVYGEENFKKEILEYCSDEFELNRREIFWVEKLNARNIGYNIAKGGNGGEILDWQQKIDMGVNDKISKANSGRKLTTIHCESISNGMSKYKKEDKYSTLSEEEKKKRKVGKYNPFYGKRHKKENLYKFLILNKYR